MSRIALPNRRPSVTVAAEWQGMSLTITVGFNDDGEAKEVFADAPGSLGVTVSDAATIISIALQHNISPADLGKSLGRVPAWINGEQIEAPASPVGTIVACLVEASE